MCVGDFDGLCARQMAVLTDEVRLQVWMLVWVVHIVLDGGWVCW